MEDSVREKSTNCLPGPAAENRAYIPGMKTGASNKWDTILLTPLIGGAS
jgi:hypothetical protein